MLDGAIPPTPLFWPPLGGWHPHSGAAFTPLEIPWLIKVPLPFFLTYSFPLNLAVAAGFAL